jgi:3-deoxy-D-manno-octulosonate 8-phosphate phosphatase (KDO 8-P phosphatase)
MHFPEIDPVIRQKAEKIRLLALDVDGVLTDGRIIYDSKGEQIQKFHVHDGLGLKLLQKAGIHIAIITSRNSKPLIKRCEELGINRLYQGVKDKNSVLETLQDELSLENKNICYVGDDLVDLPVLIRAELAVGVSDCHPMILPYVHYVTRKKGGEGAVREVCDIILIAIGKNELIMSDFLK